MLSNSCIAEATKTCRTFHQSLFLHRILSFGVVCDINHIKAIPIRQFQFAQCLWSYYPWSNEHETNPKTKSTDTQINDWNMLNSALAVLFFGSKRTYEPKRGKKEEKWKKKKHSAKEHTENYIAHSVRLDSEYWKSKFCNCMSSSLCVCV